MTYKDNAVKDLRIAYIGMEYNTVRHYKKEAYAKIREALKNEI